MEIMLDYVRLKKNGIIGQNFVFHVIKNYVVV